LIFFAEKRQQTTTSHRCLILMMYLCYPVFAFSTVSRFASLPAFVEHRQDVSSTVISSSGARIRSSFLKSSNLLIRGGGDDVGGAEIMAEGQSQQSLVHDSDSETESQTNILESKSESSIVTDRSGQVVEGKTIFSCAPYIISALKCLGASYSKSVSARPILTKSLTACITFGLSDWTAQRIESSSSSQKQQQQKSSTTYWKRTIVSAAVGFLYFGPAAHYWYEAIFNLLPSTSLASTIQKAILGQLIFGPVFTCVFFAASLLQDNVFTLKDWFTKIRKDLPGAWIAGAGFWPVVDLISYGMIPIQFIPVFINFCSFVWTIYLSLVANRRGTAQKSN